MKRDDPDRDVFWEICCDDHAQGIYSLWSPVSTLANLDEATEDEAVELMFEPAGNVKMVTGTLEEVLDFIRTIWVDQDWSRKS